MSTTRPPGVARARPMRADARRNLEQLLTSAAQAFNERGADDVSLEEIARRAGVGIGTLYRHFPTRQSLLEAVYRDQVDALSRQADELLALADPRSALEQWLAGMLAFGRTKRSLNAALLSTLTKDADLFTGCRKVLNDATTAIVERAQDAGVARSDVRPSDVMRLIHGLIVAENAAPGDEGQAGRMLSLVVGGLVMPPPE